MPNPGTISLPFGVSGAFSITDVVVVLGATELVVELVVFVDAVVEVLCGVTAKVVSMFPVGREVAVAVRSCTVTDSTVASGAVVIC